MTREGFKPRPRDRVHRGLEFRVGPLRFNVTDVHNEKATIHVVWGTMSTLGSSVVPVEVVESMLDWHGKIPVGHLPG